MRYRHALISCIALACAIASAQSVHTSPDAFPIAPASISLPVAPAGARPSGPLRYVLNAGESIHKDLQGWAAREGWELIWLPTVSWRTLRSTQIDRKDVASAVAEVVDILRDEGKPVRLRISDGNSVMEVISTEVRND